MFFAVAKKGFDPRKDALDPADWVEGCKGAHAKIRAGSGPESKGCLVRNLLTFSDWFDHRAQQYIGLGLYLQIFLIVNLCSGIIFG